ncbi:hypothetical protein LTR17_008583 [Elasticomyces elasticus]|nr:hypothetical protein LTR17_008583 [Elasticomyces elasticus]
MDHSPLRKVPAEIRNDIYELVFLSNASRPLGAIEDEEATVDVTNTSSRFSPTVAHQKLFSICQVCKQSRHESLQLSFAIRQFSIALPPGHLQRLADHSQLPALEPTHPDALKPRWSSFQAIQRDYDEIWASEARWHDQAIDWVGRIGAKNLLLSKPLLIQGGSLANYVDVDEEFVREVYDTEAGEQFCMPFTSADAAVEACGLSVTPPQRMKYYGAERQGNVTV